MSSSDSDELSASGSDSQAEGSLQHANASPAGPNLAQLRGRPLQRQVDSSQFRSNDESDLQHRLAAIQLPYLPRGQVPSPPSTISSRRSDTSSMAVSVLSSRSTLASGLSSSQYSSLTVPSLCESRSTWKSVSSIRTSAAGQYYGREPNEDDMFELSEEESDGNLQCCFAFLHCPRTFNDLEEWDRHCRTHYGSNLPAVACCPFSGCAWSKRTQPGEDVWGQRLSHMLEEHAGDDFEHEGRPDATVVDHLFRARLIDSAQYQELRRDGRLSERPVMNTASRREEHRRRR